MRKNSLVLNKLGRVVNGLLFLFALSTTGYYFAGTTLPKRPLNAPLQSNSCYYCDYVLQDKGYCYPIVPIVHGVLGGVPVHRTFYLGTILYFLTQRYSEKKQCIVRTFSRAQNSAFIKATPH